MRRVTHCQVKRRPDKAFTPPSGDMPGGAALAGHTNHRRPDKAFTPPSGITPRLPACGYAS
ncbi:hypothetical protein MC77_009825 [Citrobacter koseri]|nr:hypothetical protein MC77_009825 [Citrobacter koseri]